MPAPTVTGDRFGVVIGNSLADRSLIDGARRLDADTPWGGLVAHEVAGALVVCRHGIDRYTPAHRLDHRRTVAGLAALGCDRVLGVASTGSLGQHPVGTVLVPDDFVAFTAYASFHDDEHGHAVPGFDAAWRRAVIDGWRGSTGHPLVDAGVYVQTRGPRFETPAEVRVLAGWGDVVGMTIADEAILAREAGIAYAALCTVDNMANGLATGALTVADFHAGVAANQAVLRPALEWLLPALARTPRPAPDSPAGGAG